MTLTYADVAVHARSHHISPTLNDNKKEQQQKHKKHNHTLNAPTTSHVLPTPTPIPTPTRVFASTPRAFSLYHQVPPPTPANSPHDVIASPSSSPPPSSSRTVITHAPSRARPRAHALVCGRVNERTLGHGPSPHTHTAYKP